MEQHAWHWENESCQCGAPTVRGNRPYSVSSTIPVYREVRQR